MHRLRNQILLFVPTAAAALTALGLHRYMMETCIDDMGLLIGGNLPGKLLWVLTIGFVGYLLILLSTLGGRGSYGDNFPRNALCGLLIPELSFQDVLRFTRNICSDPEVDLNEAVYDSEMKTCSRNRSIAYLLQSKGILNKDVADTLRFYTKMCSMSATADSLSNLGAILANDGVCGETGKRFMSSRTARIAKTLMLTCGMYDGSGTFAIKVGIPTKSGVGGGLLSVSDKRAGLGVFGPALDTQGNSIAGCKLLREISNDLRLNLFYDPEWNKETEEENELIKGIRESHII